jgi:hypothetical protein
MSRTTFPSMSGWADRPLCRRYAAVVMDRLTVEPPPYEGGGACEYFWALGALKGGQTEVLGWWRHSPEAPSDWPTIAAALATRGVEDIQVLVDDSGLSDGRPPYAIPRVHARTPDLELSPRIRQRVDQAQTTAKKIHATLARGIKRKQAADAAVSAYLGKRLQQVDCMLSDQTAVA